jgi:spore germination protein YaaH
MKKYLIAVIIALLIVSVYLVYVIYKPNLRKPDIDDNMIIYEGGILTGLSPLFLDEDIYLPYDLIKKYIDEDIFLDENHKLITVIRNDELIRLKEKDIMLHNDHVYVDKEIIESIYPLTMDKRSGGLVIFDNRQSRKFTMIGAEVKIRYDKSLYSDYMEITDPKDLLYIIEESPDWYKVMSENGNLGFVRDKEILDIKTQAAIYADKPRPVKLLTDKKVFAWEMMYSVPEDPEDLVIYEGIDIISPTWIELKNKSGAIDHRIVAHYSNRLSREGIFIFPCVTNDFNDPEMTGDFLLDPYAREKFISDLINICEKNKFQGINIDFENIPYTYREHFTQFIRELSFHTHKNDLFLTVCTGIMGGSLNYSRVYDHKKIGEFADAIMIMSYDELPYSGKVHGPVADHKWQEQKISEIAYIVDPEKIYLGIPLYTRIWKLNNEDDYSSIAVSLRRQEEILTENEDGLLVYDEKSEQYTLRYTKNDIDYLMYIEDSDVMDRRMDILKKYDLAGAAFWAKNYVDPDFFDAFAN